MGNILPSQLHEGVWPSRLHICLFILQGVLCMDIHSIIIIILTLDIINIANSWCMVTYHVICNQTVSLRSLETCFKNLYRVKPP